MSMALASATQLSAQHCIEMVEIARADHVRMTSVVRSAVDIQSPGDLMTLTVAAATALQGEATLKSRLPKEARKNASISPFEKGILESKSSSLYTTDLCLLSSHIIIKINNKHVGGAFYKNNKCVVYGVCDETTAGLYQKERELSEDFKCKSKFHKQRWVEGLRNLLRRVAIEETKGSLGFLSISNII
ncbi:hypothetical protein UlMin_023113 [Ulmus minor]